MMTDNEGKGQFAIQDSPLLGIAIPTYQRYGEFCRLIQQLSSQILALPPQTQGLLRVTVLENPSRFTQDKVSFFDASDFGFCDKVKIVNSLNIGGDANIEQAYSSQPDALYTWRLGDDEQILDSCISNLLIAIADSRDVGLFLLRDTSFKIKKELIQALEWDDYASFTSQASIIQPNMLLAHSLISGNIVRSELFCRDASKHERILVSRRHGLPFCFAHMMGMLVGLSRAPLGKAKVRIINVPVIDTTQRAMSSDPVVNHQVFMHMLYRKHVSWICSEFGVDFYNYVFCSRGDYMLPSSRVLANLTCRVLLVKLKKLFEPLFACLRQVKSAFRFIVNRLC